MSTRREAPNPIPPTATDVGALGALPPILDPRALGEVAGGLTVPMAMPFSLFGAEGEAKAMHPPLAGSDPRGLPPKAFAVAQGAAPGSVPGSWGLPLPGAASPFLPGEASVAKLEGPPTGVEAGMPPAPPAPSGAGAPASPPNGASWSLPPLEGWVPPAVGQAPPPDAATPAAGGIPAAALPRDAQVTHPPIGGDPTSVPGGGAAPAPPADVPAPTGSPEEAVALHVALDLMERLGAPASGPEHAVLSQADRPDASLHLPTSDPELRDALGLATGPVMPEAPAESLVQGATLPAAEPSVPDFYFLPAEPAAPDVAPDSAPSFDPHAVRSDFPALHQHVNGKPLVWLDNAATTHKPQAVIDAVARFYEKDNSNIHRGAHTLAARATEAYESARDTVRRFLGASEPEEIVFARGTTEAINLVMNAWGRKHIQGGDEIVLTLLEHHANIVPWQMLRQKTGCVLKVVPITDRGEVDLEAYTSLLGPRTKLVAVTQVSNALGTVVPVQEMATLAHRHGAMVLVDGAQSVPHIRVNVQDIGADFLVFSGHKIFAPMGIGVLYAKKAILEDMDPWQGGGSMIVDVTFERTIYAQPPAKFEAGTPSVGDAVGLGAALDYVERLGIENMARYEDELLQYGTEMLKTVPGLRLIGTAPEKVSVMSFLLEGTRPEDVGRYLNTEGIAVRAGHHCAQPTVRRFGTEGTVRPSLAVYNNVEDIDRLVDALRRYRTSGR
jgi:cysteine desulfurase/selenocysteine lyase